MGFDLEIIFQGMCTFVPERDGSKLWVLMLDRARRGNDRIPPHAAMIRFDLENLLPGTPGFGLRRLDNFDVRISGLPETGVTLTGFDAQTGSSKGAQGTDSFAWVSPLEDACAHRGLAGGGVIDPAFLAPLDQLTNESADLMAARFLFTAGTVSTHKLTGFNRQVLESVFRPPNVATLGTDLRQPTAARVVLRTFIDADSVTFRTKSLRTTLPARALTLRPVSNSRKLSVSILNEEGDSLVGLQGEPIHLGQERDQDRIFLSMFEFCRRPPAADVRPMPIPLASSALFPSPPGIVILDGAPPCSPSRGDAPTT
jgi:hypothetical protein